MTITTVEELRRMKRVGKVVSEALDAMKKKVAVGVSTLALDEACARVFERHGARSAPQLVYNFPGAACISLNYEAVHGIPLASRFLKAGDLVKLDVTAELDGFFADAAITVPVSKVSQQNMKLAECAESALRVGIEAAQVGQPLNQNGSGVHTEVERCGFKVMRQLGGHGVGRTIHEEPSVPNFYDPKISQILSSGLVIAIEPVISGGSGMSAEGDDGWTVMTADGAPSAHFEHTVVITDEGPVIVTA